MTDTQQVWLTQDAYQRLNDELQLLLRQRDADAAPGAVPGERDENDEQSPARRERDQRIRKLQQILRGAVVGQEPPDDGIAEPGMVVTVAFDDGGDEETFLLAEREQDASPGLEVCSPESPLGRALIGAAEGEQREYRLPDGGTMAVTLVRAVPYGSYRRD